MKLEVIADAQGLPLGTAVAAANLAETTLVQPALDDVPISIPQGTKIVADGGYDSDPLRDELADQGFALVSPHRRNRVRPSRNDGRVMRRYCRRFVIERTNSWLHCFRRLAHRWEHYTFMYQGFLRLACILLASYRL
jgi:transposase